VALAAEAAISHAEHEYECAAASGDAALGDAAEPAALVVAAVHAGVEPAQMPGSWQPVMPVAGSAK